MERNKDMTSQVILERKRRRNENGINRKIDRMLQEERMRKIITELSRVMITWKRQWIDLTLTNETSFQITIQFYCKGVSAACFVSLYHIDLFKL